MNKIEIPERTKKVKVTGTISYEMEVTIKGQNEADHDEDECHECMNFRCDLTDSVDTIQEAEGVVLERLKERIGDVVLGLSDLGGLIEFKVENI